MPAGTRGEQREAEHPHLVALSRLAGAVEARAVIRSCGRGRLGCAFDIDAGQESAEPFRQPPGGGAEQVHDRRDQEEPDDGRVDEDAGGQADRQPRTARISGGRDS